MEIELELRNLQERYEGTVFTPSEEREFSHIRQKLDRDIKLHYDLYRQVEGSKSSAKVGKEVYRANLLSVLVDFVGMGRHRFRQYSIELSLFENLKKSNLLAGTPELTRRYFESIEDNPILELQTYGLDRIVEVDGHRPQNSVCEFTDKMYRFVYWLDYNNYTPKIYFELISTVEEIEEPSPKTPPRRSNSSTLSLAQEIDGELRYKDYYHTWSTTGTGVLAARQRFETLCQELIHYIEESNANSEKFKVVFNREGDEGCVLSALGLSLVIQWNCKHADKLDDSALLVTGYKPGTVEEGQQSNAEMDSFVQAQYRIELNKERIVRWRSKEGKPVHSTVYLAASLLSTLLAEVRDRVVYNKV